MSVEKYNPKMHYESIPYAQININVIQTLTNMEAGYVWVYLQTKPKDWKIIKEHLKNHFNIGNAKIKKIFAYLAKHNLIEYVREDREKGQFGKGDINVLSGSNFISYPQDSTTGSENRPPVNRTSGSGLLHIKENTKEIKSREQARKKRSPLPEFFEPSAESKALAKERGLDIRSVFDKFNAHAKAEAWKKDDWDAAFMKWVLDEKESKPIIGKNVKVVMNEIRSTVPEYGPGHPSWEAMNEWNKKNQKEVEKRNSKFL